MAARRPMVAMMPLSRYRNGWVGRPPSLVWRIWRAAWRPDWMATWASWGQISARVLGAGPQGTAAASPMA